MPSFATHDVELYFEEHGRGAPLVLVAGIASDSSSWLPVLDELAQRFRVVVFDHRGTGRTAPAEATTSVDAMADDCIALMRHLDLAPAHLVGHSMGGFVAQAVAVRSPERVAKLVLAATSTRTSRRNVDLFRGWAEALERGADPALFLRNLFYWLFSPRFFERSKDVDDLIRLALAYPYPQLATAFRRQADALAAFDSSPWLGRITSPTLVLSGRQDLLFPVADCETLAERLPNARLAIIDEAAHSIHFEYPAHFLREIDGFLER